MSDQIHTDPKHTASLKEQYAKKLRYIVNNDAIRVFSKVGGKPRNASVT